jgi:membrane-anchored protein YejM (alkaline phosphatase superfamily)
LSRQVDALRGSRRDYNVLIYYVDTLRHDVASDPSVMPHSVEFAKQSLEFRRAYAPGSDTLHSLPGITSGNYEQTQGSNTDILHVAKRAKLERVLVIPQSAHEFLAKLRPYFEFDHAIKIADYRPQEGEVWGYGANQPTSERIVDRTLEWLGENKGKRFFLWAFNFDQHNWREIDKDWVHAVAAKYEVPDEALVNWRYRVVATAIDRELQRLLDGLEQLDLDEDTIVIFMSDHGEGLGRDGFWVHSVFLWDCLVRVPLAIRVPGMGHRVVYDKVSLVDLVPPRRLPILLAGVSQENLVRIGLVDPERDWKLVLPLESGAPELYDLSVTDPDWLNVAEEHPREVANLLSQLVRSPLFPRSSDDVSVQAREQRPAAPP